MKHDEPCNLYPNQEFVLSGMYSFWNINYYKRRIKYVDKIKLKRFEVNLHTPIKSSHNLIKTWGDIFTKKKHINKLKHVPSQHTQMELT
jgi:hypothetical protein